jgi:hypothetical protein
MALDFNRLNAKIKALEEKNSTTVASTVSYVFPLGSGFTAAAFTAHKNKLLNILIACRNNTEAQVTSKRSTAYNALTAAGKVEANKIINNTGNPNLTAFSGTELDRLMEIMLYTYIIV